MAAQLKTNDNFESEEKFTVLFNMYAKALKRKANSILRDNGWAEDAVQWAFLKLLRHMDRIDDPCSDRTRCYLYTILTNNCYTILKKNNRYCLMDDYTMQVDFGTKLVGRDESVEHVLCEELLNDVRKIPEIYSNLMILHAVYNYSLQEISSMLELKPATVRKRMQRGREMLAAIRDKYDKT